MEDDADGYPGVEAVVAQAVARRRAQYASELTMTTRQGADNTKTFEPGDALAPDSAG